MFPYALVLFDDGIYYVCETKEFKMRNGNLASVPWKKKAYYKVTIIEEGYSKQKLIQKQKVLENLEKEKICVSGSGNRTQQEDQHNDIHTNLKEGVEGLAQNVVKEILNKPKCDGIEEKKTIWCYESIILKEGYTKEELVQKRKEEEHGHISATPKIVKKQSNHSYPSKGQACLFCGKIVVKIPRHLVLLHGNEPRVQEFACLLPGDKSRKMLIDNLRKEGNYKHNLSNTQIPIISRRVCKSTSSAIVYCPICKGTMNKQWFSSHTKKCVPDREKYSTKQLSVQGKLLCMTIHPLANPILKEQILPTLRIDDVSSRILNDKLVILYGNEQTLKYKSIHNHAMIRSNLRLIGRLLNEAINLSDNITDFTSCFVPTNFDAVISSINKVARLNNSTGIYEAPDTAAALGTLLKYVASLLEAQYIKEENADGIQKVQYFSTLLRTGLPSTINKTVVENKTARYRRKQVVLPTIKDIQAVLEHSRSAAIKSYEELHKKFSQKVWLEMAKALLVNLIVYNRRRPGETERFKITDYLETCCSIGDNDDILERGKHFKRYSIRGKLNRTVPLLIENDLEPCVKALIQNREAAGVCHENPFVFGIASKAPAYKYLRGYFLLKQIAEKVCEHPDRMKATLLRKQLATKSSNLIINNKDKQETLHKFLGHHRDIHETYYRQPDFKKDLNYVPLLLDAASGLQQNITQEQPNADLTQNGVRLSPDVSSSVVNEGHTFSESPIIKIEDQIQLNPPESSVEEKCVTHWQDQDLSGDETDYIPLSLEEESSLDSEIDIPRTKKRRFSKTKKLPKERNRFLDISLGPVKRRSWTIAEREAVKKYFKDEFVEKLLPSTEQCLAAIQTCPELNSRTPKQLKSWVHNQISQIRVDKKNTWRTPEKKIIKKEFYSYIKNGQYPPSQQIRHILRKYPELKRRTENMVRSQIQHAISKIKQGLQIEDLF